MCRPAVSVPTTCRAVARRSPPSAKHEPRARVPLGPTCASKKQVWSDSNIAVTAQHSHSREGSACSRISRTGARRVAHHVLPAPMTTSPCSRPAYPRGPRPQRSLNKITRAGCRFVRAARLRVAEGGSWSWRVHRGWRPAVAAPPGAVNRLKAQQDVPSPRPKGPGRITEASAAQSFAEPASVTYGVSRGPGGFMQADGSVRPGRSPGTSVRLPWRWALPPR